MYMQFANIRQKFQELKMILIKIRLSFPAEWFDKVETHNWLMFLKSFYQKAKLFLCTQPLLSLSSHKLSV